MKPSPRTTTFLTPRQRGHRGRLGDVPEARTHWFTWRHIRFKLTETPNPSFNGWIVLRLDAIASRDTPVPVTPTGFLMHTMETETLADAGGAVAFITDWLDRQAGTKAYQEREFLWRQGDLFDDISQDSRS